MFLIRTVVGPSRIHGVGTFAAEDAAEGQVIWRFDPAYDLVVPLSRVGSLPAAFRHYLETYAYLAKEIPDSYVLSCDHAKFLNHSEQPNTSLRPFETLARVPIRTGDEITCDYRAFVVDWNGFEPAKSQSGSAVARAAPAETSRQSLVDEAVCDSVSTSSAS